MTTPIYDNATIVARLNRAQEIARRIDRMRHERATRACRDAGIGGISMCVLHNCMIALEEGRPWRELDYSKVRLAVRILKYMPSPGMIVDRFYRRMVGLQVRA